MIARYAKRFRLNLRQAAGVLALLGIIFSSAGVVVVPQAGRDSTAMYPCQGGRCGCATAEQCWVSCCCTTLAERLQWAKQNRVTPPESVARQQAAERSRTACPTGSCCSSLGDQAEPVACTTIREASTSIRLAVTEQVNRCRGLASYQAVFGAAICQPIPEPPAFALLPGEWLRTDDDALAPLTLPPPLPPPRVVV